MQHINTLFLGQYHISFRSIDSTNTYAFELLKSEKVAEGTIITAQHQYAGRGQRGSEWQGDMGKNLAMSVILYPTFLALGQQFVFSQAMALGVFHTINDLLVAKVRIKWPNDLYVGDKKMGGMLIENSINHNSWLASVVGIGININQDTFSTHLPNPTSMFCETGHEWSVDAIVKKLCHNLEQQYLQLKADNLTVIRQQYCQNLYRFDEVCNFELKDKTVIRAKIIGTDNHQGKLILVCQNLDNNSVSEWFTQSFDIKELRFLP